MGDLAALLSETDAVGAFCGTDAPRLTDAIRATDDATLSRLLGDDTVREAGVTALLGRFAEFADPDRFARLAGVVRFELSHDDHHECRTVRFDGGRLSMQPGAEPDVTLTARLLDFVRLVTGQANAGLLYLAGRLAVAGRELLALDVGAVFRLPGTDQAAVDPTRLDPVDVATAIKGVSRDHLRTVMGGSLREVVVGEVFRRMPDFVDAGKASGLVVDVGFTVSGRADGDADRYVVHVRRGQCSVDADPDGKLERDATLLLDGPDFLRLVLGQVNPIRALVSGRLKLTGDKAKALSFNAVMTPPRAR